MKTQCILMFILVLANVTNAQKVRGNATLKSYDVIFEEFQNANNKADSLKLIPDLKKSANNGHYISIDVLAYLYYYGKAVNKDYEQARFWLCKAAAYANNKGIHEFFLYDIFNAGGYGIIKNADSSIYWLFKSADKNYPDALFKLGGLYYSMADTVKNGLQLSFDYLYKATTFGHRDARYALGIYYLYGYGTDIDYYKAFNCFEIAAAEGNALARIKLGDLYALGAGVPQSFSKAFLNYYHASFIPDLPDDVPLTIYDSLCNRFFNKTIELSQLALSLEKHAAKGNTLANLTLWHLKRNSDRGGEEIKACLEQNIPEAQYEYALTLNPEKDKLKQLELYKKAAEAGNPNALEEMGKHYYFDKDDCAEAVKYFLNATDACPFLPDSWYNLAMIYLADSCNVKQDPVKAFAYLSNPVLDESNNAHFYKARMYEKGLGVVQNFKKAAEHYMQSLVIRETIEPFHYDLEAKVHLGRLHYLGKGVERDHGMSMKYLSLLIGNNGEYLYMNKNDLASAKFYLADMLKKGYAKYSEIEIKENINELAKRLLTEACTNGIAEACSLLNKRGS